MHDLELLRQYSQEGSQAAFAELVSRHVDLVYSSARRQVWSAQLAQEITQAVFLDLARQAGKLRADSHLGSWLYVVTRRASIDAIREESRRQKREQTAAEGAALNALSPAWTKVEPVLDEVISSLGETDRMAILLRFFERKNFSEIGQTLGASEAAAQKRVSRAIEHLRESLARRGVTTTASVLAAEIPSQAMLGAPAGLAASIAGAIALAHPAAQQAALFQSAHTLAMTFAQKAAVTAVIAAALAAGLYENSIIRRQAQQIAALEKENDLGHEQFRQLGREGAADAAKAAALRKANAKLEGGGLDPASNDPTDVALRSWLTRVSQLRQRLEEQPGLKIPELQFADAQDWLDAAKANLNDESDYRRALANLRMNAALKFQPLLQAALKKYSAENGGGFPGDPTQLAPYFEDPIDPAVLQRYAVVPRSSELMGGKTGDEFIVTRAPVDPQYDYSTVIGARGNGYMGPQKPNTIRGMLDAFFAANHGQVLTSYAQLAPYATTPAQQATLQKALQPPATR